MGFGHTDWNLVLKPSLRAYYPIGSPPYSVSNQSQKKKVIMMDECRRRLRKVGRKGVEGSSGDFYFASLDGNLVLDGGEGSGSRH